MDTIDATAYRSMLSREGSPDYEQLQQGPEMTALRYAWVNTIARPQDTVIDLGCGTGLALDFLSAAGNKPSYYVGYDLLEERLSHVDRRLKEHEVTGQFIPGDARLEDFLVRFSSENGGADLVLAVNVFGSAGYQTALDLHELVRVLTYSCDRFALTVPVLYPGYRHPMPRLTEEGARLALPVGAKATLIHPGILGVFRAV